MHLWTTEMADTYPANQMCTLRFIRVCPVISPGRMYVTLVWRSVLVHYIAVVSGLAHRSLHISACPWDAGLMGVTILTSLCAASPPSPSSDVPVRPSFSASTCVVWCGVGRLPTAHVTTAVCIHVCCLAKCVCCCHCRPRAS